MISMPASLAGMLRPITRAEYDRMVEAGVFGEDRVELLYGAIVRMPPHGPPHDSTLERLAEALMHAAPPQARVRVQSSFAASDGSEPEPDLAIVARRDYDDAHPSEAFLLVEVAVSSLAVDLGAKAQLYAESGVPEYWVVDVDGKSVVVHTQPRAGRYQQLSTHRAGDTVTPTTLPSLRIAVSTFVR